MFGGLGLPELIIILFIILIIFGVGKLPEIGRGLGEGIKNFRKASRDTTETPKKLSQVDCQVTDSAENGEDKGTS